MLPMRPAADATPAGWLLGSGADWWDLVRWGAPGYAAYLRIPLDAVGPDGRDLDAMRLALEVLAAHTTTPDVAFVAAWEGHGLGPVPAAPRVRVPHREQLLFTGPVSAVRLAHQSIWIHPGEPPDTGIGMEPDLAWPEDRAWMLACDVDEEVEFSVGCSIPAAEALDAALPGLVRRAAYGEDAPLLRPD